MKKRQKKKDKARQDKKRKKKRKQASIPSFNLGPKLKDHPLSPFPLHIKQAMSALLIYLKNIFIECMICARHSCSVLGYHSIKISAYISNHEADAMEKIYRLR